MEASENTIKLYYNTEVEKLQMPEYGRNVLHMVEQIKEIPDRSKRTEQAYAVVKVMDIVHAKDVKHFYNITATSVPMTITPNGYSFSGQNINTIATYRSWTDSIGTPKTTTTDAYPFKTFSATVDLVNDTLVTNFMMGPSATVAASGRTYPNYTAY